MSGRYRAIPTHSLDALRLRAVVTLSFSLPSCGQVRSPPWKMHGVLSLVPRDVPKVANVVVGMFETMHTILLRDCLLTGFRCGISLMASLPLMVHRPLASRSFRQCWCLFCTCTFCFAATLRWLVWQSPHAVVHECAPNSLNHQERHELISHFPEFQAYVLSNLFFESFFCFIFGLVDHCGIGRCEILL